MASNSKQYLKGSILDASFGDLNGSSLAASFGEVRSFVTKKKTKKETDLAKDINPSKDINPLKKTDPSKDINQLKETDRSKVIVGNTNCDDQYKFKDRRKTESVNPMKFKYEKDEFPSLGQKSKSSKQSESKCWSTNDVTTIRISCDTGVLPTVKLPPLYPQSNTEKSNNSPTFTYNYNVEKEEEFDDEDDDYGGEQDDYEGEQDEEYAIDRYYANEHNANIGSTKYDAQR